ncbi:MAG: NAD(P)-dependent oxidoreductase [Sneathiellales bacterium]|nr:NAD(P)-dependent oxidoreductase [Sneathiellales bacterium]
MNKVGVIGLGRMGTALAQKLVKQDISVKGWTRSGRKVKGVECVSSLEEIVIKSDTLILSLLDDDAVADILDHLLELDLNGKLIVETSTVVPAILTDRIATITRKGAMAVDAPIAGGPELVLAGQCGFFIGGEDAAVSRAREILEAITNRLFHVGPLGTGLVMKTINNSMLQVYLSGLNDLMPLAHKAGLPLETALRILSGGPAGMPMIADRIPKILGEDKDVGFALSAAFKDNDVFNRVLKSYGLSSVALASFGDLQAKAEKEGLIERDPAELISLSYHEKASDED